MLSYMSDTSTVVHDITDGMRDRIRRNVKALLALYGNGKTTALMPVLDISRAKAYRLLDANDVAEFSSVEVYRIATTYGIDVGRLYGNPDELFGRPGPNDGGAVVRREGIEPPTR